MDTVDWDDQLKMLEVMKILTQHLVLTHKEAKEIVLKELDWYSRNSRYSIKPNS